MKFNLIGVTCLLLFIILIATEYANACMCGHSSVREAYNSANTIIIGKVIKIENPEMDERNSYKGNQTVFIELVKSFKGSKQKVLTLSQENSTCDWWFDEFKNLGKTYLFYLSKYKKKDIYGVISCGRSKKTTQASDDLSWLSGLPKSLSRTRISGVTLQDDYENIFPNDYDDPFPPLANVKLNIFGKNMKFELVTDKNGFYELWDVPVGMYSVVAETPKGFILNWTTSIPEDWTYFWSIDEPNKKALEFTIEPKNSGGVNFMFKKKKDEN